MYQDPPQLPRRSNRPNPPTRLLLAVLGLVCAVLTTATAASVYVAGDASRRATARLTRVPMLFPQTHKQGAAVHALIDSLVAPLGTLPPMDSAMLRDAVAFLGDRTFPGAWISFDTSRTGALDTLEFMRQWSKSKPLPPFWGYRTPIGATEEYWARLPIRRLSAAKRFALLNEAVADSALLAGDAETAMTRARELLAGSRHLIDQPLVIDMMIGRYMLQRGARLLTRSAQQAGEPMIAGAAKRLDAMAAANYSLSQEELHALTRMGESPEDGRLTAFVGDRGLPASIRAETPLTAMLSAACLNPREMMFGLSSARRAAFDEALTALSDIPRMSEMTPLMQRAMDTFDSPGAFLARFKARGGTGFARPLPALLVPATLWERVEFCRFQGM